MKTTKESVFEFIQKQLMTNSDYKDGISTKVIAEYFQLQRSNVSTLLNELVKDDVWKRQILDLYYIIYHKKKLVMN